MQITPYIHALKTPLGPDPGRFVYVYLIYGDGITVIDTGFNGTEKLITGYIRSTGRDPSEIRLIILTHAHPDHTGSAKALRDLTGCTIAAHPLDAPSIEHPDPMLLKPPAPACSHWLAGECRSADRWRRERLSIAGTGSYLTCFPPRDTRRAPSPFS